MLHVRPSPPTEEMGARFGQLSAFASFFRKEKHTLKQYLENKSEIPKCHMDSYKISLQMTRQTHLYKTMGYSYRAIIQLYH